MPRLLILVLLLQMSVQLGGADKELTDCLKECGLDIPYFSQAQSRSMGGHPKIQAPFTGRLIFNIPGCDFDSSCTATIVDQKFLISASHCINYSFELAKEKCESLKNDKINQDSYNAGKMIFHTKNIKFVAQSNVSTENIANVYKIETVYRVKLGIEDTDVMLMKLKDPITFTVNKRPACLFKDYSPVESDQLRFFGFGKVPQIAANEDRPPKVGDALVRTNLVHEVLLPVYSDAKCGLDFPRRSSEYICVGGYGLGLTEGDSGGAAYQQKNGRLFVVGVASTARVVEDTISVEGMRRDIYPDALIRLTKQICAKIESKSGSAVKCLSELQPPSEKCRQRLFKENFNAWQAKGDEAPSRFIDDESTRGEKSVQFAPNPVTTQTPFSPLRPKHINATTPSIELTKEEQNLIANKLGPNPQAHICEILSTRVCFSANVLRPCELGCVAYDGTCRRPFVINRRITTHLYFKASPAFWAQLFYARVDSSCSDDGSKRCRLNWMCTKLTWGEWFMTWVNWAF